MTCTGTAKIGTPGTLQFAGGYLRAEAVNIADGVIRLLGGALPPNLVNNGVVIDSSAVKTQSYTHAAGTMTLTISSHAAHTYQLQRSTNLTTWTDLGSVQAGNGTVLTFTDTAASPAPGTSGIFYGVAVR